MHGDTVPRVLAQLVECQCGVLSDLEVRGRVEVGDQGPHGPTLTERGSVFGPVAATADGQSQVGPQHFVLSAGEPGKLLDHSVVSYHCQVLFVPEKYQ